MDRAYAAIVEARKARLDVLRNNELTEVCALLTDRVTEAYEPLVRIAELGSGHEQHWLLLSLASSLQQQLYSGQFEYCDRVLRQYWTEEWGTSFPYKAPTSNNSRSVQVLTLLALGVRDGRVGWLWLDWALKLDPSNVMAAKQSMSVFISMEQYSRARAVINQILPRIADPALKMHFTERLEAIEGKADGVLQLLDPLTL